MRIWLRLTASKNFQWLSLASTLAFANHRVPAREGTVMARSQAYLCRQTIHSPQVILSLRKTRVKIYQNWTSWSTWPLQVPRVRISRVCRMMDRGARKDFDNASRKATILRGRLAKAVVWHAYFSCNSTSSGSRDLSTAQLPWHVEVFQSFTRREHSSTIPYHTARGHER